MGFTPALEHLRVQNGWATWSNGYAGDVYWTGGGKTMTFTLPAGTNAFYFYAEPNPFATFNISATAQDGTTSGPISVDGFASAQYFGFFTDGSVALKSIEVDSQIDFAVGEFAIAGGRHYHIESKAWIPQPLVVDPIQPVDHFPLALMALPNRLLSGPCRQPSSFLGVFNPFNNFLETSRYKGDAHIPYPGAWRALVAIDFDWDGAQISNLVTTKNDGATFRFARWTIDGKTVFCTTKGQASPADSVGTVTSPNQFNIAIGTKAGTNPLVPLAPHFEGTITGSVAPDGAVTLVDRTSAFPSVGFDVSINGVAAHTFTTNDVGCLSNTDVLGIPGAIRLARGLHFGLPTDIFSSASATIPANAVGRTGSQSSPLCGGLLIARPSAVASSVPATDTTAPNTPPQLPDLASASRAADDSDEDGGTHPCDRTDCGAIAGTVHGAPASGPVEDVCVVATTPGGSAVARTVTDSDGEYRIARLLPGSYNVLFQECGDGRHQTQWFSDADLQDGGTLVQVIADRTVEGIDAHLVPGSVITGQVFKSDGEPLEGICARAVDAAGHFADSRPSSEEHGAYRLGGLPAGTYSVSFSDCSGGDYLTQSLSRSVTVSGSDTAPNVDITMTKGGEIRGRVTSDSADPLPGACVAVQQATTQVPAGHAGPTGESGRYVVHAIPSGTYNVFFTDCRTGTRVAQAWKDQPLATPSSVSVTNGKATTGIDARLRLGGSISGTVTDAAGQSIAGACATATALSGIGGNTSAPSDESGRYEIEGLETGSYSIQFADCTGGNRISQSRVAPVAVIIGRATTGIDQSLPTGGVIIGSVHSAGGAPLQNVCVTALDASQEQVGTAVTGPDGTYSVAGLPSGTYHVSFEDCYGSRHVVQWFDNQPSESTATPVHVDAGATVAAINATLALRS